MPRASTYWKNPEKYRKQAREYYYKHKKKKRHVPEKSRESLPITLGKNNSVFEEFKKRGRYVTELKNEIIVSSHPLEDIRKDFLKYYSEKNISRTLKHAEDLGLAYFCDGYWFMPLSTFLEAHEQQEIEEQSDSYAKGYQGVIDLIPVLQKGFPTSKYYGIYVNPVEQKGVDILIDKEGIPHCVIEVTNYEKTSFLHTKDIDRYIENLNYWSSKYPDIFKVIVIRYPENLKNNPSSRNAYVKFVQNNIGIKVLPKFPK